MSTYAQIIASSSISIGGSTVTQCDLCKYKVLQSGGKVRICSKSSQGPPKIDIHEIIFKKDGAMKHSATYLSPNTLPETDWFTPSKFGPQTFKEFAQYLSELANLGNMVKKISDLDQYQGLVFQSGLTVDGELVWTYVSKTETHRHVGIIDLMKLVGDDGEFPSHDMMKSEQLMLAMFK